MALEIITNTISLDQTMPSFTFSDQVGSYIYGISGFQIGYGSSDHLLETFDISLTSNLTGDTVSITPTVTFHDKSKNNYDPASSTLSVTVAAWIGDDANENVVMVNQTGTQDGDSAAINLGNTAYTGTAILSGMSYAYPSGQDHDVLSIYAHTGVDNQPQTNEVSTKASLGLYDGSGNYPSSLSLDTAFIAKLNTSPGFGMKVWQADPSVVSGQSVAIDFGQTINQAGFFIGGYQLAYGGNTQHFILQISVGQIGHTTINGSTATFDSVWINMHDDTEHQSMVNNLTMIAIASYASS